MSKSKKWVNVENAIFCHASGNSVFNNSLPLGNVWELLLVDGRTVTRAVRYKPQKRGEHWGSGWHRRRSYEDSLPAPKRVLVQPVTIKD